LYLFHSENLNENSASLCLEKFPRSGNRSEFGEEFGEGSLEPLSAHGEALLQNFSLRLLSAPLRLKTLRINEMLYLGQRAEAERQRAETAEQENARLREQLRALGVDPDALM